LKDFAVPGCIPAAHQDRHIEISYHTLTQYLNEAEAGYQAMNGNNDWLQLPVGRKKRKRVRTPPSTLSDGREAEFQQQEEETIRRESVKKGGHQGEQ